MHAVTWSPTLYTADLCHLGLLQRLSAHGSSWTYPPKGALSTHNFRWATLHPQLQVGHSPTTIRGGILSTQNFRRDTLHPQLQAGHSPPTTPVSTLFTHYLRGGEVHSPPNILESTLSTYYCRGVPLSMQCFRYFTLHPLLQGLHTLHTLFPGTSLSNH